MHNKTELFYPQLLDIKRGKVEMNHGSGGRAMSQLINELFVKHLGNELLAQGNDGTVLPLLEKSLVISTDAHVISPIFFPGGDIGSLSVYGTVNDIAMMGATPLYLSASFILEEGFPLADLNRIAQSMADAAARAAVKLVAGDTKVVEKGKGDGIFITTTGLGALTTELRLSGDNAQINDAILLSGSIGEHGMAIITQRENLQFDTPIISDTAPLNNLVKTMLASGAEIHVLRDPTRGGIAATLNEIAQQSRIGMILEETAIPIQPAVNAACELLGLDPLNIANEGKLIAICAMSDAPRLLAAMRSHPLGQNAALVGRVIADKNYFVRMKTSCGGQRMVDWLSGEPLPRIC